MINEKSVSKKQRHLMGWAYACAKGKSKNCPPFIQNVVDDFTKDGKRKGISKLRDFAKTKEKGLPSKIVKEFTEFKKKKSGDV